MMKIVSCLALALLPLAQSGPNDLTGCIMSNTNEINAMVDSALFIYVSSKKCKAGVDNYCVSDLAATVNAVMGVGEFMVKVFKTCGEIKTSNFDCSIAGAKLTGALASVTSAAAAAAGDCKAPGDSIKATPGSMGSKPWTYAGADVCNINIGAAMSGLQGAITSLMTVKGKCGGSHVEGAKCFSGVLDIISAVGNLAVFIENVAANCNNGGLAVANACATDIAGVLSGLAATASGAAGIKTGCTAKSTRLYTEGAEKLSEPAAIVGANLMSAMLVVFLPISGWASYSMGSRFTKARTTRRIPAATVSGNLE